MNSDVLARSIRSLTPSLYAPTRDFMTRFYAHIIWTVRGQGSFGAVHFLDNDKTKVVKVEAPCNRFDTDRCESLDVLIEYRPHDGKTLLELNSILVEGTIGSVLNTLVPYTPHFATINGAYYSAFYRQSYVVMERLEPIAEPLLRQDGVMWQLVFQVFHALYVAQSKYRFVHFDLHLGNIMSATPVVKHTYRVPSQSGFYNVSLKDPMIDTRVIDFGLSRLETDNVIVNQTHDALSGDDRGQFNPYYDMAIVYGMVQYEGLTDVAHDLLPMLFVDGQIPAEADTDADAPLGRYFERFRPLPEFFSTFQNRLRPVHAVLQRLVTFLKSRDMLEPSTRRKPVVEWTFEKRPVVPFPAGGESVPRGVAFTSFADAETGVEASVALVYPDAIRLGAAFRTVCCKMDPETYAKHHRSIAINGSDTNEFFEPVGAYRETLATRLYESHVETRDALDAYYGWVTFDGGSLDIAPREPEIANDAFQVGPLLVSGGTVRMTPDAMRTESIPLHGGIPAYHCEFSDADDEYIEKNDHAVFNCEYMQPGDFFDGDRPKRRSMLMIDEKGVVGLVVMTGVTLAGLAAFAGRQGAKTAVALGDPASMAWRTGDAVHVTKRRHKQPAGNLLVLDL